MRSFFSVFISLLLMFFGGTAGFSDLIGSPAPKLEIEGWVNSEALTLDDLKGKIVILDFFATNILACRETIPVINDYYDQYSGGKVVVISITREKNAQYLQDFAAKHEIFHPIGYASTTEKKYGVGKLPFAVLIGKSGRVMWWGHPLFGLKEALKKIL